MIALLLLACLQAAPPEERWVKGNTHAHTLWDDGDALPETVVDWYLRHGYQFLVLSDHNDRNAMSGRPGPLKTYDDLARAFNCDGEFALLPGEEIGDVFQGKLVHHTVVNSERIILPRGGATLRDVLGNALADVRAEGERLKRPVLAHLNHPNLGWAVSADDLVAVDERFVEIYSGHPSVKTAGDETHPSVEAMWDHALAARLRAGTGLIYGIACDDAHHYSGKGKARPGRGWVMVRVRELSGDAVVRAMLAGDFYASTGVVLRDVRADARRMTVRVAAEDGVHYRVRFIGAAGVLQESEGAEAAYEFRGDELYVRAVVTSDRLQSDPVRDGDVQTAWAQPVAVRPRPGPRAAEGWSLDLVAQAPRVRHPSVVCCAPDGRIFVGEDPIDMEGPIDARIDRVLCLHPDGRMTVFAEGLGPVFGLMYLEGRVYVQHPPKFSVYRDVDGVGKDRVDLIECTNPTPTAGNGLNDHIPANFHLGMDGTFYVAVGQKGVYNRDFQMREGGVLRMRPDGTGLEVFARGVRNVMDVAINSEEELFGYDNDDHTKTWKVKLIHFVDGGYYGFPWDFKPARPTTLGGIAEYKSGAPTGILAYTEDALPAEYRDNLVLCDWGRRTVFRVKLARDGATYKVVGQEDLIPPGPDDFRPVGITTTPEGMGFYVTDWNFAAWKRRKDDAGRLYKLTWKGPSQAAPKPDWYAAAARGEKVEVPPDALKHPSRNVRLAAMRQLGPLKPKEYSLTDPDAAARFKAAAALGRKGDRAAVPGLLAALADDDAVVRHGAMAALQRIGAWSDTVAGLKSDNPRIRQGTLYALREAYDLVVVDALIARLHEPDVVCTLAGLLRKPEPWDGRWWRNGPYAYCEDDPKAAPRIEHTVDWEGTERVLAALKPLPDAAAKEALNPPKPRETKSVKSAVADPGTPVNAPDPAPYAEFALHASGDPARGNVLFHDAKVGCTRCHRIRGEGGQIGPDLAGIGTKYGRPSLIESVLYPSRQIAEGYAQTLVRTRDGTVLAGLVRVETADELTLVDAEGTLHALRKADLDARRLGERSLMPDGLQAALTLQDFADLISFLESLQDNEGFVPLFNGKDLAGWKAGKDHEGHWVVKDGVVRYDAKGPDLWTEKAYADFILKADFRFPGTPVEKDAPIILPDGSVSTRTEKVMDAGDSGIFLRGAQKSQVNLWCWPVGSGEIYGYRTDGKLPPEVRAGATPKQRADKPPGEWNHLVITIKGDILTVVLNDQTVIDHARLPGVPAKGPIGLQHPGKPLTPDMPVEFANFLIKELP